MRESKAAANIGLNERRGEVVNESVVLLIKCSAL